MARATFVCFAVAAVSLAASGCGRTIIELDTDDGSSGAEPPVASTTDYGPEVDDHTADRLDMGPAGCEPGRLGCTDRLDVLLVVDNSATMAEEQRTLARGVPRLVETLRTLTDASGSSIELDVQVMVTTTDVGNPECTPFEPAGYEPARGAAIHSACTTRLQDFTNLTGSVSAPEVCLDACPSGIEPADPFVAFGPAGSNVPDVPALDIDGDGTPDSPEAQALACIGPQGFNGCGFESPLQAMRLALDPEAEHNRGDRPFLRPDAALAVIIVTDEIDCSVRDVSVMIDPTYQNINPYNGTKQLSSAICWNAGMRCEGPDASGVYSQCRSEQEDLMQPVELYTTLLREELDRDVVMVQLVGVPEVVAHAPDPPFEPVEGGEHELVYRDWLDHVYPAGDILPDEWAAGITAANKEFEFGIGPGCTGVLPDGSFSGQATPPVRLLEVCHGLDLEGDPAFSVRCCVESICDDDYGGAITCLQGMLIGIDHDPGLEPG